MRRILFIFFLFLGFATVAHAQFQPDMGNANTSSRTDTSSYADAGPSFKFKTYFTALAHKDTLPIQRVWSGSVVLPGYGQIYNRQYWKIPVIYAGIGGSIYMATRFNSKFKETEDEKYLNYRTAAFAGAALFYLGGMLDGVVSYKTDNRYLPPRATLLSSMVPGLGQIYNGDYWKLPIIYGGLTACAYFLQFNTMQYKRFKKMYNRATEEGSTFKTWMTPDNIKWYRDSYRRYRDYSILATLAVYFINIVDANVFAHLHDFDVSDELSFQWTPTIIEPTLNQWAGVSRPSACGIKFNLTF